MAVTRIPKWQGERTPRRALTRLLHLTGGSGRFEQLRPLVHEPRRRTRPHQPGGIGLEQTHGVFDRLRQP
jgi:hypothetical protein